MTTADKIKDYGNALVDKGGEGWTAFYALADFVDSLFSEDEPNKVYQTICGDILVTEHEETDTEITKRVMEGYWEEQRAKDFHDDWISPIDWLDTKE